MSELEKKQARIRYIDEHSQEKKTPTPPYLERYVALSKSSRELIDAVVIMAIVIAVFYFTVDFFL